MHNDKRQERLKAFSKLFMELLNDLNTIRPGDATLLWVKAAASLLSEEALVEQFMDYVGEYTDRILNRDESFFVNELHKSVKSETFAAKELARVKAIWIDPSTTDDTKECIWKYFILLVKLGKAIQKN